MHAVFRELDSCAAALRAFDPDLVVVFGPDHFNGFFYELMPAFCIGTAAGEQRLAAGRRPAAEFPASSRCPASATCSRAISTWRSRTR